MTSGLGQARPRPLNILGLGSFLAGYDVEDNLLAFLQRLETSPENRRVMDEHIRTTLLDDEAESMPVIEPFYFTTGHSIPLPRV